MSKNYKKKDDRIIIVNSGINIRKMLEEKGYPFKSKEHSEKLSTYQRSGKTKTVLNYLGEGEKKSFLCPKCLKYQFTPDFKLKVSKKCCEELKKKISKKWAEENKKEITITGMRNEEGGLRKSVKNCTIFAESDLVKFHPLLPVGESWINEFIKNNNIELCKLYYPPYNFERTGCCGCPYNVHLQQELDVMEQLLPEERKKCEIIWEKVYQEYRDTGYRLK